jgi:dUTP pyrophosphatase
MKIKIKKLHENAVVPSYSKNGDAGMDLTVVSTESLNDYYNKYNFGIAIEIPFGYVGLIFPRSSSYKQGQILSNCVGVIDSGYRGEISAVFLTDAYSKHRYNIGDRAAQMLILPYPQIEFELTDELSDSERGLGGYGSSGK